MSFFTLTEEYEELKHKMKSFVEENIISGAEVVDRNAEFPWDNVQKIAEYGIFGFPFPKKYGGTEKSMLSYAIALEEIARGSASTATVCVAHSLSSFCIYLFGNELQKQRYLAPMAKGEKLGALALTEKTGGSDVVSMQTVAKLENSEYVLNGSKYFITNAGKADFYIIFAYTDRDKGSKGISAFIVEKDAHGFSFGKIEDFVGLRGISCGELLFDQCKIPEENLIGKEGEGMKIALTCINRGRLGSAAIGVGIAQAALDASKEFAKQRIQFGKPIADFQYIRFMISDMATEVDATRLHTYRAACLADKGEPFIKESSMAKLYSSEVAVKTTMNAVQIHGGYGLSKGLPIERYFRDARALTIMEGTSEIQRMIISREELK